jgi:Flp pilus assembly protein TadG
MKRSRVGKRQQNGVTTLEFAIVGLLLFVILFAVIEFGRALFVMNTLTEATRRGARLAAVCPVGDPKPASAAVFDTGTGRSAVVSGLTSANILIEYLDINGTVIGAPGANFSQIRYVRASVVGFSLSLVIPTIMPTLPMSGFTTTLPRESLGIPRSGVVTAC